MKTIYRLGYAALVALVLTGSCSGQTQSAPKPRSPNNPATRYSFPIRAGGRHFRFKVRIDKRGVVTGVTVFRAGDATPLQTLAACMPEPEGDPLDEDDEDLNLVKHADLNFDGFDDLELRVYRIDHLAKNVYCIYLWDNKAGRFVYSPEISDEAVNPEVHPESKTVTMHELWQGAAWQDSTYRWKNRKLELIEQNGILGDWSLPTDKECGLEFTCSRLIDGKMVVTLEKPICKPEDMFPLPDCPAAVTPTTPETPQ